MDKPSFISDEEELIDSLNDLLPQTQCGQCGYSGCYPYAQAIALENQAIDRCAPGGVVTLKKLAAFLGQNPQPYEAEMAAQFKSPVKAEIREAECIGCTKCIQACPVDAILGASKQMHTVIADVCTGCGLCAPPCPVDCIDLVPHHLPNLLQPNFIQQSRQRYQQHQARLDRQKQEKIQEYQS
ncbi:MAG: RnfABCDGE type electron transport complex subunit B, partial [Proteobacteria bacterium]|nr:RnfABCDGE type electron transport complex subunit B [Pseudomonadota bacterium]